MFTNPNLIYLNWFEHQEWNIHNQNWITTTDVCSVLFIFCLYVCVCKCLLQINLAGVPSSRVTFGVPQYCASTCVPHTHPCAYARACMGVCVCMSLWIRLYMHICGHKFMCMYMDMRRQVCGYICTYIQRSACRLSNNTRRQEGANPVDFVYICPFLSSPSPLPPFLSWYHHISV